MIYREIKPQSNNPETLLTREEYNIAIRYKSLGLLGTTNSNNLRYELEIRSNQLRDKLEKTKAKLKSAKQIVNRGRKIKRYIFMLLVTSMTYIINSYIPNLFLTWFFLLILYCISKLP